MSMSTLKELAVQYATKQPKQVDALTEKAPILDALPFDEASHGLWNAYEDLSNIQGAGFVEMNAPLPVIAADADLKKVDLAIMGGEIEVPEDKARMFGGKEQYFSKKMDAILRASGMAAEKKIIYDNFRAFALDHGAALSAGAETDACYSILAVRFEPGVTCGLYSPEGFKRGSLLDSLPINGGALYKNAQGVLVFGMRVKGYFGIQIADPRTVAAIVNINADNVPTAAQVDDLLAMVRADSADTKLFMHMRCKNMLNRYKAGDGQGGGSLQTLPATKDLNRTFEAWNGIPIVASYNFLEGAETAVALD
ncbi:hypothetical protein dsat_1776 [Alkalidesulfovibrio alkalitolerans DSM 16529]|jgi:hypothetical protein|uniref:Uncharacterized protein n=1 Tax=Alkalidesulfovibrio alkalitolerans DSM 16529 TaxID=1121439 RepID=S7UV88_9BACT|nr:hypothetical protein [Alkalidesulfovibrio alkalitolerans]EPR36248.1 hypothetical protein dsat_1776 [Alkalidesulfovibrio alkalitolerans DSM 16529]